MFILLQPGELRLQYYIDSRHDLRIVRLIINGQPPFWRNCIWNLASEIYYAPLFGSVCRIEIMAEVYVFMATELWNDPTTIELAIYMGRHINAILKY